MTNERNYEIPVLTLAAANFLAALGGGTVLGRAMGVLENHPWLKGDSILAFLLGMAIGLLILFMIPKAVVRKAHFSLALGAASLSLCLFLIVQTYATSDDHLEGFWAWVFFSTLSVRFALWFLSRVVRSDIAAGHEQKISWVELQYYLGIIVGLVVWQRSPLHVNVSMALMIDFIFQLLACGMDLGSRYQLRLRHETSEKTNVGQLASKGDLPIFRKDRYVRLVASVVAMTVAVQIVLFAYAHSNPFIERVSTSFGSDLIAAFYVGLALAAIFCAYSKIALVVKTGRLDFVIFGRQFTFSALALALVDFAILITVIGADLPAVSASAALLGVVLSAFLYEIIALSLLDRIGFEATQSGKSGMVSTAFGIMGFVAAIAFWLILRGSDLKTSLFVCMFLCFVVVQISLIQIRRTTAAEL